MPSKDPDYHAKWRARQSPEYNRTRHLKSAYGISPEEYSSFLESQGGVCGNCGTSNPGGKLNHFRVDHCHATGAIRGLLCQRCNIGLGYLGDNIAGLQSAVHYLSKSEPTLFLGIWKRIAPTTCSSPSEPYDPEMPSECSSSRFSSETSTNAATAGTVKT
jgi:hypothetical protein